MWVVENVAIISIKTFYLFLTEKFHVKTLSLQQCKILTEHAFYPPPQFSIAFDTVA